MQQAHVANVMNVKAVFQAHHQPRTVHRHAQNVLRILELADVRLLLEMANLEDKQSDKRVSRERCGKFE